MRTHTEEITLPYTPEQIYALVADVGDWRFSSPDPALAAVEIGPFGGLRVDMRRGSGLADPLVVEDGLDPAATVVVGLTDDDNVDRAVDALALLMAWYSFDGYLLNIENPIEVNFYSQRE